MNHQKSSNKPVKLSDGTTLDPFIEKILLQRGISGEDTVKKFLEPKLSDLPSPFLMKDMDIAVKAIETALRNGQQILVWGDYDVDGTTATALLLKFFHSIGCKADYYIPNRLTEGYGLQKEALEKVTTNGNHIEKVLITVDNGISAHEAVELATKLGYKTIITDHHTPPPTRVHAAAVLNPKQKECGFPDKNLAGVGVAFYFAMGIRSHLVKIGFFKDHKEAPNLKLLLDLVGIGTVADMVPLEGINRTLVKAGMETLGQQTNKGLTALCRRTKLDCRFIRSEDISFQIAPKINAAGRLGQADRAIHLFLAESNKEALGIASDLVKNNEKRKSININDFIKAIDDVSKAENNATGTVVVSGGYHVGVAGIVASNLVEKYKKPSVVLCDHGGDELKGSARSVKGVDLYRALEACQDLLINFGGHKMAGGMSLSKDNLEEFRQLFDKAVYSQNKGKPVEYTDEIDANIAISELFTRELLKQLHLLEPFGQGNPQPIFRDTHTTITQLSSIGKDKKHLRMDFINGKSKIKIKGIGFGLGELEAECKTNRHKEILYTPSINFFKGKRSWQVRVTNIIF